MDNKLFNDIETFLEPHMDNDSREAIVERALFGSPVLSTIDFSGSAHDFTVRLVKKLWLYGKPELIAVLEVIEIGEEGRVAINTLVDRIQASRAEQDATNIQNERPLLRPESVVQPQQNIPTIRPEDTPVIKIPSTQPDTLSAKKHGDKDPSQGNTTLIVTVIVAIIGAIATIAAIITVQPGLLNRFIATETSQILVSATPTLTPSITPPPAPSQTPTLSAEQRLATLEAAANATAETAETLREAAMSLNPLIPFPRSSALLGNPREPYPIPAFYLNQYEVSRAQYALCIQAGACENVSQFDETIETEAKLPITYVSANTAWDFCAWLGLRLPSGAEWERAARGTDGRKWPWGNRPITPLLANVRVGSASNVIPPLLEVDTYEAGRIPEGILHLVGNASEWTRTPEVCGINHYTCIELWDGQAAVDSLMIYDFGVGGIIESNHSLDNLIAGIPTAPSVTDERLGFRCAVDN
jgi:formylglycine-generating enzyme required for sulfatase activity